MAINASRETGHRYKIVVRHHIGDDGLQRGVEYAVVCEFRVDGERYERLETNYTPERSVAITAMNKLNDKLFARAS